MTTAVIFIRADENLIKLVTMVEKKGLNNYLSRTTVVRNWVETRIRENDLLQMEASRYCLICEY